MPTRNGHTLGAWYARNGEKFMLTAPPKFDDVNPIDRWSANRKEKRASYTIEIFETSGRPVHFWRPGPGRGGYKVLWKKTFEISLPAAPASKPAPDTKAKGAALAPRNLNRPQIQSSASAEIKKKIAYYERAFRAQTQRGAGKKASGDAAGTLPALP